MNGSACGATQPACFEVLAPLRESVKSRFSSLPFRSPFPQGQHQPSLPPSFTTSPQAYFDLTNTHTNQLLPPSAPYPSVPSKNPLCTHASVFFSHPPPIEQAREPVRSSLLTSS